MLEVKCPEYMQKVVEFAEKKGLKKELEERLDYLRKYADPEQKGLCRVELTKDFAPASFSVNWYKRNAAGEYAHWITGGMIFHGDQSGWNEKAGHVDPLNVRIGSDPNPWSICT